MPAVVAFPGVTGSFSMGAAMQAFPEAEYLACEDFEAAARAAAVRRADYALLPVENSFAGVVIPTYSLLEKQPLFIVGEVRRGIRHQLLGLPGATLADIRRISSHPQAIAQCDAFLAGLRGVEILPSANTAISARAVAMGGDPTVAAIASREAAEAFGLTVIRADIQTSDRNTTRFFIVSAEPRTLGKPDKATVVFRVKNEAGALARVLNIFARYGLNMCRIESRPLPETPFHYFFSADFEGEMDAGRFEAAMDEARAGAVQLRVLGLYPRAAEVG